MTDRHVTQTAQTQQPPDGTVRDVFFDGALGGLVGIVAAALPFSTVLGGATAGYLYGGSRRDGAVTGAVAGVVMLLPLVAGGVAVSLLAVPLPAPQLAPEAVAVLAAAFGIFYVLGPAVVGGVLGAIARRRGWFE